MRNIELKRFPVGNDRYSWKQKEFVMSTFTAAAIDVKKAVRNFKEAGFNMLELGWVSHQKAWEAVEACENEGIQLIFQDFSIMGGMMHRYLDRKVADETIIQTVSRLQNKKYTVGYYVWDEPWRKDMIAEARRQADIINQTDSDALCFSCFPPSYNPGPKWETGEYELAFDYYVQHMDPPVISFDHYPFGDYFGLYDGITYEDSKQLDNAILWCDMGLARALSLKYCRPFWYYYQGCPLFRVTEKIDFSMMRMTVYAAIMYGAKGVQQYAMSNWNAENTSERLTGDYVVDHYGEKGIYFEDQKKLHKELSMLGPTLMALTSTLVYHSQDVCIDEKYAPFFQKYNNRVEESLLICGELPKRISIGEFRDDYGNEYVMILNRDYYQSASADIRLRSRKNVYQLNRENGKQSLIACSSKAVSVELSPGDAVLYRLQNPEEELYTIDYVI